MEEKRRLEKLLFADINSTTARYKSGRGTARADLAEQALKLPDVRALLDLYLATKRKMQQHEHNLQRVGFGISSYPEGKVYVREPGKIRSLRDYDVETERVEKSLSDLKRTYTLKLFAGGEEAKELFASLARELAAIVKQR